jgi:nitrate reductase delta subunit
MNSLAPLALLFDYPDDGFDARLEAALGTHPSESLDGFACAMRGLPPEDREEIHAATFEITPSCVPYVSIHLFGEENFKRGEFMAALLARYAETGFDRGGELPDHIANLLRYFDTCDKEEQRELAAHCLLTPLEKMTAALSEANPYSPLLTATTAAVRDACPGVEAVAVAKPSGAPAACAVGCCGPVPSAEHSPNPDQEILTASVYD